MKLMRAATILMLLAIGCACLAQTGMRLKPGDLVRVLCEEEPTVSAEYRLDKVGNAQINLVGKLNLAGLTEEEAAASIKAAVEAKAIVLRATVTVKLLLPKDAPIFYGGAVEKGGEAAARSGLRLSDVVLLAEPTSAADLRKVRILSRDGQVLIVDYSAGQNPELRPGDQILFPLHERAQEVYVLGGVKHPGRIAYRKGLTVKEILEECGGPLPHANVWRTKLVKASGEEWPIDLETDGGQVKVEPGDTLTVPLVDRQRFVTVAGAVAKPGIVELQFGMDMKKAIEMAGGLLPEADPTGISVKRVRPTGEKFFYPTTPLQAYDIVNVPFSREKSNAIVQTALRLISFLSVFGR